MNEEFPSQNRIFYEHVVGRSMKLNLVTNAVKKMKNGKAVGSYDTLRDTGID